jgi:hypothetical protein
MQSNVTQQRVPIHGDPGHWVHVSDSPRHVRVMFGGETIADSKRVKLVREPEILPAYYFPKETSGRIFSCRASIKAGARSKVKLRTGRSKLASNALKARPGVILPRFQRS